MLIERFIAHIARKKNANYLQFSPRVSHTIPRKRSDTPLLLYVHVPFCEELCPYCSFNRVVFEEALARRYFEALRKEVLMYKELGYDFGALYVGGGTPTILIDELAGTVELIKKTYQIMEISVETNPNHLTDENIKILKEIGVNRLSVGVQTFDDELLSTIGRYHKYGSGEEIAERLRSTQGKFNTLNADMIFNFPTQTMAILEEDLSQLLDLKVDQITYYPLMVSDYTRGVMREKVGAVEYGRGKEFYTRITDRLASIYDPTTAWCFSRADGMIDEYVINYEEYAGLGSGSIGYIGGNVYANTFDIVDYVHRVGKGEFPVVAKRECSIKERLLYDFLMKLFGIHLDLDELGRKYGEDVDEYLRWEIAFFKAVGGMEQRGHILSLTKKGQYYWVIMMREFFIGVNNFRDYCREIAQLSSHSH